MVLEERKCPNCGSNEILEKNGTFVCMNCKTFFDRPTETTTTHVYRDETEIERINFQKHVFEKEYERATKNEKEHDDWIKTLKYLAIAIPLILFFLLLSKIHW